MQIKVELTTEDLIEEVANIEPVGITEIDSNRFERQLEMENLLDTLIDRLHIVSSCRGSYEFSVSRAGEEAYEWLCNLRDELNESL